MDALLSIVQMPKGVPVATVAIGSWGAANAAILSRRSAQSDAALAERLAAIVARCPTRSRNGPGAWPTSCGRGPAPGSLP